MAVHGHRIFNHFGVQNSPHRHVPVSTFWGMVQAQKLPTFVRTMLPAAGWDLHELLPAHSMLFTNAQCRLVVASHVVCAAAAVSGVRPLGRDAAPIWTSLERLTEAPPDATHELPALCVQLLTCCVRSMSKTLNAWPGAADPSPPDPMTPETAAAEADQRPSTEPAHGIAPRAAGCESGRASHGLYGVVRPWLEVIDSHIGDVVALLPDASVHQEPYAELAAAAAHHSTAAAAAAAGPAAAVACRSARRLWAAFVREPEIPAAAPLEDSSEQSEGSSDTSQDAGTGEDSAGRGALAASIPSTSKAESEDDSDLEEQGSGQRHTSAATKQQPQEAPASAPSDESASNDSSSDPSPASEDPSDRQAAGRNSGGHSCNAASSRQAEDAAARPAANLKVAAAALQALSAVASSDAAMAVLFDTSAIKARFALPAVVADVPLPLDSVAMLGELGDGLSAVAGGDAGGVGPVHADRGLKHLAGSQAGGASAVRTELLLLIEVRPHALALHDCMATSVQQTDRKSSAACHEVFSSVP